MPIKTFIFIIFSLSFNSSFTVAIAQERPSSDIPTVQNKSSLTNSRPDEEKSLVLLNQIYKEFVENKLTFSWWWALISGIFSIGGFIAASYFYWKSKRTDQVVSGFFKAITAESHSVLNEMEKIRAISNPDYFNTMKAKIETAYSFMASLNHTIFVFGETLWPPKNNNKS
ncbi:MAG: hypothetical protein JRI62_04255 [Deltaproteobacteria bacterium]|nr:hypothetical protein [Deltaproteobacteria bacterium]